LRNKGFCGVCGARGVEGETMRVPPCLCVLVWLVLSLWLLALSLCRGGSVVSGVNDSGVMYWCDWYRGYGLVMGGL
jgi:hypothetical protein